MKSARLHHPIPESFAGIAGSGSLVVKQKKRPGIGSVHLTMCMCMCMKKMPVAGAPEASL